MPMKNSKNATFYKRPSPQIELYYFLAIIQPISTKDVVNTTLNPCKAVNDRMLLSNKWPWSECFETFNQATPFIFKRILVSSSCKDIWDFNNPTERNTL